ncbi:16S rRNA (uracil(1498)-N(3))-methyltransferase [Virgibacillus xinjiangensis]|uniref:Ribosomal RNA small subunit methyltransferase E n=1 Tax=Virgibacillus xinjiangensis TaxID=393090 RepID=A0ABV7CS54_9BACI
MQRYFVPQENWKSEQVFITNDDFHHITRVMRFKEDDSLICNHPDGRAYICEISGIEKNQVVAVIREKLEGSAELPVGVTIAQGLPKGDKMELIIQKGTELGAASFIPFQADRSIVVWNGKKMEKKLERYSKITKEASEQSHRNKIPNIHQTMSLSELLEESAPYDVKIFPYEEEAKGSQRPSFGKVLKDIHPGQHIFACIGPEGGFSPKEAEQLISHGFHPVRLGPRILRTETAALYVLASISYHFEELRCQ